MHFGNLRTALFNYLYARRKKGTFLLRIEDTDLIRSGEQYSEAILSDLQWLDLNWQEGPFHQSQRQSVYEEYYKTLEKEGLAYPCFCTEEQLTWARKAQMTAGKPPRYSGTCRHLTSKEIAEKRAAGIPSTLRFQIPKAGVIEFEDLVKGPQRFELDHIGDFIIRRGDGSASFMFCNAIDDALMGVTDALRGEDHLTNTPRQIIILNALGLPVPKYGHFPTILGPDSRPLSKRNGSRSIQELRVEGYFPIAILNYLARLGHRDEDLHLLDLETLADHFDLAHVSKSPAHYDEHQLNHWQKEAMHQCSWQVCWESMKDSIKESIPEDQIQAFVECVQPNLVMPNEGQLWAHVLFAKELSYPEEVGALMREVGPDFFKKADELFTQSVSKPDFSFQTYIRDLQQVSNRKGKALFFPLRAALSAELHGPELAKMVDLLGADKVHNRFLKAESYASNL